MCLVIDTLEHNPIFGTCLPKIASKDILCYKILRREQSEKSINYYSPCLLYEYHKGINTPLKHRPLFPKDKKYRNIVTYGYLHAYQDFEKARMEYTVQKIVNYCKVPHVNSIIVEMIIPKGTKYFLGDQKEICAEKLVWGEIVWE